MGLLLQVFSGGWSDTKRLTREIIVASKPAMMLGQAGSWDRDIDRPQAGIRQRLAPLSQFIARWIGASLASAAG